MKNLKNRIFKPMTPEQLARNDRGWVLALLVGAGFLLWDFYRSVQQGVPALGWAGYLTGPIFAHKVSEILLLILWMPVLWVMNYERAAPDPKTAQRAEEGQLSPLPGVAAVRSMGLKTGAPPWRRNMDMNCKLPCRK